MRLSLQHTSRHTGFTLVELLVAMSLGLLLVAGVAYIFLGNRTTYRQQDNLAQLQESARIAFELLDFDIRMAGFTGCTAATTANLVNDSAEGYDDLFSQPLVGFNDTGSTFPAAIVATRLRGDAIRVLRANTDREYIIPTTPGHNPTSATFGLTDPHDLKQGEVLVITDCKRAGTFQQSNPNVNNTTPNVNHDTGNNVEPGNCTKGFGPENGPPLCGNTNGIPYTYDPGSRIFRLSGNTYFIANNAAGQPALFRRRFTQSGGDAAALDDEMVEGVENMQITYGVDQSAAADKVVDNYVTADSVNTSGTPGDTEADKWGRVLSVRISLLMRTVDDNVTNAPQAYLFGGAIPITPTDRRLRKVFTTTIAIRNRL